MGVNQRSGRRAIGMGINSRNPKEVDKSHDDPETQSRRVLHFRLFVTGRSVGGGGPF